MKIFTTGAKTRPTPLDEQAAERRIERVLKMLCRFKTVEQIAKKEKVSVEVIQGDMATIAQRQQQVTTSNLVAEKRWALSRFDEISAEAWDSFERSKGKCTTTSVKTIPLVEIQRKERPTPAMREAMAAGKDYVERTVTTKMLAGDSGFLAIVLKAELVRLELLNVRRTGLAKELEALQILVESGALPPEFLDDVGEFSEHFTTRFKQLFKKLKAVPDPEQPASEQTIDVETQGETDDADNDGDARSEVHT